MTDSPTDPTRPIGTIVLVHGLWLTPRSWEHWVDRYSKLGYEVLAPAWPGMDVEVEELRRDPSVMNNLGVTQIADHYEQIIRGLPDAPIIIGHSFGGLITQVLLDRGVGAAGVALHPAPIKGVLRLPLSSLKSSFPILRNPLSKGSTVELSPEQFHYGFTNTLSAEESQELYDRYEVPGPGRPIWQVATANTNPRSATKVDLRNDDRAPLLLVSGSEDHVVPVSLVRETLMRYHRSTAVTEYKNYPGRPHFTMAAPGWEDVADQVLDWAAKNSRTA